MAPPMKLRFLPALLLALLVLLSGGCSTPAPEEARSSGRAEVRIKDVTMDRLQQLIVSHMAGLGYRQLDSATGFLVMERPSAMAVPGSPGLVASASKIQIAIQELEPSFLAVYAVEYAVIRTGGQSTDKEVTSNQVFMQALLEGFKARALYGSPPPSK